MTPPQIQDTDPEYYAYGDSDDNAPDTDGMDTTADLDALDFNADDEDVIDEDEYDDTGDDEDLDWVDEDDDAEDTPEGEDGDESEDTGKDRRSDDTDEDEDEDEDDLDWEAPDEFDDEDLEEEEEDTLENDPATLRDMLAKSRRENAARRKKFNEFRDQSVAAIEQGVASFIEQVADQIGVSVEDPSDADAVVDAVTAMVSGSNDQRTRAERDLAIYRAAIPAGADMTKLADSKSFTATVDTLDPTSETFATDVAQAVKAALEKDPSFKTAPKIDRSGGDFASGIPANAPADDSVEALRVKRQKRARR